MPQSRRQIAGPAAPPDPACHPYSAAARSPPPRRETATPTPARARGRLILAHVLDHRQRPPASFPPTSLTATPIRFRPDPSASAIMPPSPAIRRPRTDRPRARRIHIPAPAITPESFTTEDTTPPSNTAAIPAANFSCPRSAARTGPPRRSSAQNAPNCHHPQDRRPDRIAKHPQHGPQLPLHHLRQSPTP